MSLQGVKVLLNKHTLTHTHHLCYLYLEHIGFNVYYCDQSKDLCSFYFLSFSFFTLLNFFFQLQTEVTLPACWKNSCSRSHSDSVLPVSHTVLLSFALSAAAECVQLGVCVCVCVSPVGLPMVSVSLSLVTVLIKELQVFFLFVSHLLSFAVCASHICTHRLSFTASCEFRPRWWQRTREVNVNKKSQQPFGDRCVVTCSTCAQ